MSLPGNPISFWPLDDAGGGTWRDAAGSHPLSAHGTVAPGAGSPGVTTAAGSATFSGSQDLYDATTSLYPDRANGFDLALLLYVPAGGIGGQVGVMGWWQSASSGIALIYYYNSAFRFIYTDTAGGGYEVVATSFGVPPAGTWVVLQAYYDPVALQLGIGVDGTWSTLTVARPITTTATDPFYIGQYDGGNRLTGRVEAAGIYPLLNPTSRAAVYNELSGTPTPTPTPNPTPTPALLPVVICDGNSLTYGYESSNPATKSYPAVLATLLPVGWSVQNTGVGGQTTEGMIARAASAVDSLYNSARPQNIVVAWEGINSLANTADTAAQAYASMTDYIKARKSVGFKVVLCTTIKWGTATAVKETARQAYNALVLANTAGADRVVDLASEAKFSDPTNATYFNGDSIHLTDAGYAAVAGYLAACLLDQNDPHVPKNQWFQSKTRNPSYAPLRPWGRKPRLHRHPR